MQFARADAEIPDIVFGLKILSALTTVTPSQCNVGTRYREWTCLRKSDALPRRALFM